MSETELDAAFMEFAAAVGMVMDTAADREDFAARGALFQDHGSDVHDHQARP